MNGLEHGRDPERRFVTQEEASRMVELWTQSVDPSGAEAIDLRDVAEALHIPEEEATRLLARVRQTPPAVVKDDPSVFTALLLILLILSVAFAASSALILALELLDGHPFESRDVLALLASFAWLLLWAFLCRRPLARAVTHAARRLAQPHR